MKKMPCEWPTKRPCKNAGIAIIGLPGPESMKVCSKHFYQWQREQKKKAH